MSSTNLNLTTEAVHGYLTYIPPATPSSPNTYSMHAVFQIPMDWEYYSCNVDSPTTESTPSHCGPIGTQDTYQLISIILKNKPGEPECTEYKTFDNLFPGVEQDNCHHKVIAQVEFLQQNGNTDPSDRRTIIRTIDADANGG